MESAAKTNMRYMETQINNFRVNDCKIHRTQTTLVR